MYDREATNVEYYGNVRRKRGGTHYLHDTALAGRVHAIHDAIFRSGVHEVLVAAGPDLQRVSEPPTSLAQQYPTGSPARIGAPSSHFLMSSDLVFHVNGFDRNVKYDGQAVYALGIEPPTVAPALGAPIAGPLTGPYGWRYTYVRAETQHESEPSPETTLTLTAQAVPMTATASPDPQVNRTRRYRSTSGGAGVAWFFVDEIIGNGGAFSPDTTTDTALGSLLDEFVSDPPPLLSLLVSWPQASRLLGVSPDSPSALLYTDLLPGFPRPEAWPPENLVLVNADDGDQIVAIHALYDSIIIQKHRSTWRLRGLPPDLQLEPVHFHEDRTGIGGLSQKGVVAIDNDLFMPAQDGGYSISRWVDSGFQANRVTRAIDDLWQPLGTGVIARAHAIFYRAKRQVRIWFAAPPLSEPDTLLVLQLDATEAGDPNGWSPWTGLAASATASAVVQTTLGDRVYIGTVDGFVLDMDQATEDGWRGAEPGNGTVYDFVWAPVWHAPTLDAGVDARVRRLELTVKPFAKSTLLITPETDFGMIVPDVSQIIEPEDVFILDTDPPSLPNAGILAFEDGNGQPYLGTPLGEVRNTILVANYLALGREHSWRVENSERSADFVIEQAILRWQPLPVKRRSPTAVQVLS